MRVRKKTTTKKNGRKLPFDLQVADLAKRGIFSTQDAEKWGISKASLTRLVAAEKLSRVRRGFYIHPESKVEPSHYDFIVACKYFGSSAVVGGLSALFFHGLIPQAPRRIWVNVPHDRKTKTSLFRCLRTQIRPSIGVESYRDFKITDLDRTLVEALRFSGKVGVRQAIKATRTALAEGRTTETRLAQMAQKLGLKHVVRKYWDALEI